jgi:hypothetical protein
VRIDIVFDLIKAEGDAAVAAAQRRRDENRLLLFISKLAIPALCLP